MSDLAHTSSSTAWPRDVALDCDLETASKIISELSLPAIIDLRVDNTASVSVTVSEQSELDSLMSYMPQPLVRAV